MSTKTKSRKKYVDPLALVIKAAQQAEAMRRETYSIQLLHQLARHNETKLVPALTLLMQWALDLQLDVNQIDAKLLAELKAKGGKYAK
jgi:hypothetical protein